MPCLRVPRSAGRGARERPRAGSGRASRSYGSPRTGPHSPPAPRQGPPSPEPLARPTPNHGRYRALRRSTLERHASARRGTSRPVRWQRPQDRVIRRRSGVTARRAARDPPILCPRRSPAAPGRPPSDVPPTARLEHRARPTPCPGDGSRRRPLRERVTAREEPEEGTGRGPRATADRRASAPPWSNAPPHRCDRGGCRLRRLPRDVRRNRHGRRHSEDSAAQPTPPPRSPGPAQGAPRRSGDNALPPFTKRPSRLIIHRQIKSLQEPREKFAVPGREISTA
jgi:hypothetical protein